MGIFNACFFWGGIGNDEFSFWFAAFRFGNFDYFRKNAAGFYGVFSLVVGIAFFSTVLGYVFYYYGQKYVTAGVAGFLELLTPLTSLVLGLLFLGETLLFSQWLAILVLLVSVFHIARKA